jgi:hypothetical protein
MIISGRGGREEAGKCALPSAGMIQMETFDPSATNGCMARKPGPFTNASSVGKQAAGL